MGNLVVLLISSLIALVIGEFIFRALIFGDMEAMDKYRYPGNFAEIFSDDYWKLAYKFDRETNKPPEHPHHLLGWSLYFDHYSYMHDDYPKLGKRRPVLLYGDSFAMCVDSTDCFEDYLNADSSFSKDHYFLNYGVGGYGVGQILLLFEQTVDRFEKPFVVFSLLTKDLDRSILSVRTGQKPFFDVENDSLVLKGLPIDPNPAHFFEENPPEITSYLWRKFLYSGINFFPEKFDEKIKGKTTYLQEIREVNAKILERAIADLKARDLDFVFLIFHSEDDFRLDEDLEWRNAYLRDILDRNEVPYIWSRDLVREDEHYADYQHERYIIPIDGHPTSYLNGLIANRIKEIVLRDSLGSFTPDSLNPQFFHNQAAEFVHQMQSDSVWMTKLGAKSEELGIPLEQVMWEDALFMVRKSYLPDSLK